MHRNPPQPAHEEGGVSWGLYRLEGHLYCSLFGLPARRLLRRTIPRMVTVEEVVQSPSVELLNQCTKDQLLNIAGRFGLTIEASDKRLKETLLEVLKRELFGTGVSTEERDKKEEAALAPAVSAATAVPSPAAMSGLTFDQQK